MRTLIVEDDEILSDALAVGLALSGFTAEPVATRAEAEAALAAGGFSGLGLDLMLPDGSGLDLLRSLRAAGSALPVLMLTARDPPPDRVAGPDGGADDCPGQAPRPRRARRAPSCAAPRAAPSRASPGTASCSTPRACWARPGTKRWPPRPASSRSCARSLRAPAPC